MTGLPEPKVATNAVGMPATPAVTWKPAAFSCCCSSALLFCSWKPTSAKPQISFATPAYFSRFASMPRSIAARSSADGACADTAAMETTSNSSATPGFRRIRGHSS